MAVLARNGRENLWFGTIQRMGWFNTPNRGADVSPEGWNAGGPLLDGGAYQLGSFNSAKSYVFEWPASSTREAAQKMKSFYDGTFGRGLIYFIDPLIYNTNVLPALWADPSMAIGQEASTLVPGVIPTALDSSYPAELELPVRSAFYDLANAGVTTSATLNDSNSVFIPIPEGFQLNLGAFYVFTGTARVWYSRVSSTGSSSGSNALTAASVGSLFPTVITPAPGERGIRLWVGKTSSGAASVTLSGMHARLSPIGKSPSGPAHWIGGQGHSGCRFISAPTLINNTGVNGGQVSFAASFREVGSWVMG